MPLREVLAYIRTHRAAFLYHHLGFACLALSGYGAAAWLPSLFTARSARSSARWAS
jgi:hypothetical protein